MDPLLQVQDLSYRPTPSFGEDRQENAFLLKDIVFSVNRAQIFAITGPSGSGKSTLLQLLCRLLEPSEGEIRYAGRSFREYEPRLLRREITLVFQTPTLPCQSVLENVLLGESFRPSELGLDPEVSKKWAEQCLERLQLGTEILQKNPTQLSVGEAQRVALARALAIQPKILLLDEPTASLDANSKTAIEVALKEEMAEGLSILLVSHETRQIQDLAQHGIELQGGRVTHQW